MQGPFCVTLLPLKLPLPVTKVRLLSVVPMRFSRLSTVPAGIVEPPSLVTLTVFECVPVPQEGPLAGMMSKAKW